MPVPEPNPEPYPPLSTLTGESAINAAAEALANGHLVIIPTETVYGLAANADNPIAVARIFSTKNRPSDHPVIVHLAHSSDIDHWAIDIPDYARDLARAFWPGPMTLVLTRSTRAGDYVTGGQDTVALRVPATDITRKIIDALGTCTNKPGSGVAAPSANRFGKVSPTTVVHAIAELGDYLQPGDLAVDSGASDVGIESTIIDCTGLEPRILRHGWVTAADINAIRSLSCEPVSSDPASLEPERHTSIRAPGMLASHYAPNARIHLVHAPDEISPDESECGFLAPDKWDTPSNCVRLARPHSDAEFAQTLYASLRRADDLGLESIYVIAPTGDGVAAAIRDRLQRAATRTISAPSEGPHQGESTHR